MLGVITGSILLFFILIGILSVIAGSFGSEAVAPLKKAHILEIKLNDEIKERTSKNPFQNLNPLTLKSSNQPGLYDIISGIDKAAADENIKGIYLHNSGLTGGLASIEEIRNALIRFKASGKFIISYADAYNQSAYYLASVADTLFLHPQGMIDLRGFMAELMFFRGTLDKLEIEPQLIRHGKYKSAAESFTEFKMSPENKLQWKEMLDEFWGHSKTQIALSRKLNTEVIQQIADSATGLNPKAALAAGLADRLVFEDEVLDMLKRETGKKETEEPALITIGKYYKIPPKDLKYVKDRIAVIFATGGIDVGEGDEEKIGSETTVAAIRKARMDDKVKAIVFRVNSPGGSALASDVIWREIKLAKEKKPVVVSMGNVAASGGYYISCAADTIFCLPNTITGSIGVIGLIMNFENFFKNKLGITTDGYKTAHLADLGYPTHSMTETERRVLQNLIEYIYDDFTKKVAEGRKMDQHRVDSIGQGRVWSGIDAVRIGLIDKQGGLHDAIECAKRMAGLTEYKITQLPEQKDPIQEIMQGMLTEASLFFSGFSSEERQYIRLLRRYVPSFGAQTVLPVKFEIH